MSTGPDDTVRLNPRRDSARFRALRFGGGSLVWAVVCVIVVLAGAGGWWVLRPSPPAAVLQQTAAPVPLAVSPAPVAPAAAFAPPLANEAAILADSPDHLAIYRFASQPDVIVLQFPTLAEQGRMLNRTAALIEKVGFPRNQVLPVAAVNERIVAGGDTPATFYYGHDYRAADLLRFFAVADGVELTEEERRLQSLLTLLGWKDQQARGALISLVRQEGNPEVDAATRTTILRHELSHGLYFTDPTYAAFVRRFWTTTMSPHDRAQFTAFLASDGYDRGIEDLMMNETQAYLMFTADARFFSAGAVGLPQARIDALRREFLAQMPPSWLRALAVVPAGTAP